MRSKLRLQIASRFFTLIPFLFFVFANLPGWGWSYHTHRKIVSDALNRMPNAFIKRFEADKEIMLKGSTDPDTTLKDFQAHIYHVHKTHPITEARFRELFSQAVGELQRKEKDSNVAYTLGLFAHYIADINQPLHTAGMDGDPNEGEYHGKFEKDIQGNLSKIPVFKVDYKPVTDPLIRLQEMAVASNKYYYDIGKAYKSGNRIFDLKEIVDKQYNAAVQNVIDYWLGIMNAAGQPLDLTGSSTPALAMRTFQDSSATLQLSKGTYSFAKININTAPLDDLMKIPGIGEKKGKLLISGRPYKSIFDLSRLKGFGVKFLDRISDRITVGP